jgi:hypothetical protein
MNLDQLKLYTEKLATIEKLECELAPKIAELSS